MLLLLLLLPPKSTLRTHPFPPPILRALPWCSRSPPLRSAPLLAAGKSLRLRRKQADGAGTLGASSTPVVDDAMLQALAGHQQQQQQGHGQLGSAAEGGPDALRQALMAELMRGMTAAGEPELAAATAGGMEVVSAGPGRSPGLGSWGGGARPRPGMLLHRQAGAAGDAASMLGRMATSYSRLRLAGAPHSLGLEWQEQQGGLLRDGRASPVTTLDGPGTGGPSASSSPGKQQEARATARQEGGDHGGVPATATTGGREASEWWPQRFGLLQEAPYLQAQHTTTHAAAVSDDATSRLAGPWWVRVGAAAAGYCRCASASPPA